VARKPRKRPPKRVDPLGDARRLFAADRFDDSRHCSVESRPDRDVGVPELGEVLRNGFWEPSRDRYDESLGSWSYSIRGKTDDDRELRIPVAFEPDDDAEGDERLLIVTVYEV
jgi:hypothetical protein